MERKNLTAAEADEMVDSVFDKALVRWYNKWGESPWGYALVDPLWKGPVLIAIWLLIRWNKDTRQLLNDPATFLAHRWPYLLFLYLVAVILKRAAWKQKAVEYYIRASTTEDWKKPQADGPLALSAKRSMQKLPALYRRWGRNKGKLLLLCTLLTPVAGLLPIYISHAAKEGSYSWSTFVTVFEGGLTLLLPVAGIFALFGFGLGYALWKQIVSNHQLLETFKSTGSER